MGRGLDTAGGRNGLAVRIKANVIAAVASDTIGGYEPARRHPRHRLPWLQLDSNLTQSDPTSIGVQGPLCQVYCSSRDKSYLLVFLAKAVCSRQHRMAHNCKMQVLSLFVVFGSFHALVSAACGDSEELATYSLEFQGLWSERSFPKSFPKYRKNAQWSTLIGVAHDDHLTMWTPGERATRPFKNFAEGEDSSGNELQREMLNIPGSSACFGGKSMSTGTGRATSRVSLNRDHTKISLAVHVIPSPDWFVGVSKLDLCEGGSWRREPLHVDLRPWDAGTDGGFSFTSPDYVSNPQEPITQITSHYPNHPANSFFYPRLDGLPPIARLTLVWEGSGPAKPWLPSITTEEATKSSISSSKVMEQETVMPYDCEVTPWGSWSPCDSLCKVGLRRRFRVVIERPRNGGQDCPPLIDLEACQTTLTKPQKKCAKTRIKKETKKYMKIMRRNYMGKKKRNRFIV